MNHPTPEQIIHDQLTDYRIKRDQKRFARRVFILASAILLSGAVFLFIGVFLFSLRTIAVTGSERYSYEEIVQASGISLEDNLLMLSESEVSASIKKACPYVKEVILQKEYPDAVTIVIKEEFITFAYDMLGGREAALPWASLAQACLTARLPSQEGAGCARLGDATGAFLTSAPLLPCLCT